METRLSVCDAATGKSISLFVRANVAFWSQLQVQVESEFSIAAEAQIFLTENGLHFTEISFPALNSDLLIFAFDLICTQQEQPGSMPSRCADSLREARRLTAERTSALRQGLDRVSVVAESGNEEAFVSSRLLKPCSETVTSKNAGSSPSRATIDRRIDQHAAAADVNRQFLAFFLLFIVYSVSTIFGRNGQKAFKFNWKKW